MNMYCPLSEMRKHQIAMASLVEYDMHPSPPNHKEHHICMSCWGIRVNNIVVWSSRLDLSLSNQCCRRSDVVVSPNWGDPPYVVKQSFHNCNHQSRACAPCWLQNTCLQKSSCNVYHQVALECTITLHLFTIFFGDFSISFFFSNFFLLEIILVFWLSNISKSLFWEITGLVTNLIALKAANAFCNLLSFCIGLLLVSLSEWHSTRLSIEIASRRFHPD